MKTALIIGSTGLTGSHLLQILLESPKYDKVISFVRKKGELSHTKLQEHIINFDNPTEYCDLVRGDDFFCTIGTTIKQAGSKDAFKKVDFNYPKEFANCAQDNGIKQYLFISAMGADSASSNFYSKTKGQIEDFLKQSSIPSVSIMRPSLLLGDRDEFRLAESIGGAVMKILSFAFVGPLKKYKAIKGATLAKAMYEIAQKNNESFKIYQSDQLQDLGAN